MMVARADQWTFPYHHLAPRDIQANLRFRQRMNAFGHESEENANTLWMMCSRDPLFFINTFAWIFDAITPADRPFVTWDFQDEALKDMFRSIGVKDVGTEKSRDMGASWMMLAVFFWYFLFRDKTSFMLVSWKQDLVDKAENPDCLFWKLDYLLARLPTWMKPEVNRVLLHLKNLENGAVIDGTSTTGDIARGGRRTAVGIDEHASFNFDDGYAAFAATQAVTKTRMFLSTPKGAAGAYFDVMDDKDTIMTRIRLHWRRHPMKRRGLYTSEGGNLQILDEGYEFPDGYEYILDGKLRSPWYDAECKRPGSTPRLMAQEHDIEYLGSGNPFFKSKMLDLVEDRDVREPLLVGELQFLEDTCQPIKFVERENGGLRLWMNLDARGRPSKGNYYVAGADISAGTGASNSCLSVCNRGTGEKVAEFVTPNQTPEEFARTCAAICYWFEGADAERVYGNPFDDSEPDFALDESVHAVAPVASIGCKLIWESNGPGRQFELQLQRVGYHHVFYRETAIAENRVSRKVSDIPGWSSTIEKKKRLLGDYGDAWEQGKFLNPSRESVQEARRFVHLKNGGVGHIKGESEPDPSGARANHGDRVIGDALCCKLMQDRRIVVKREPVKVLDGCFLDRRNKRKSGGREKNNELVGW